MKKIRIKRKLPEESQLHFLKRLVRLLKNGYPLIEALEVIQWDESMEHIAKKMIDHLKSGFHLDEVFENVHFHHSIVTYLYFVRVNGDLITSIDKAILMFEHRITYLKKFRQIIRYPLLLLFIFIILVSFIKKSILPSFNQLFESNASSSKTVHLSIQIIDYVSSFIVISIIVLSCIGLLFYFLKKHIPIEFQIRMYDKIPFVRLFIRMQTTYFFAMHFSMLLKAGISMQEILKMMSRQNKHLILSHYALIMTNNLKQGYEISPLIIAFQMLEVQLANIFQRNSNASTLERDLTTYADLLAETINQKIMRVIMYIQPIFFAVLAGSIIFIYIILMWPMFQLIKTI